MRAVRLLLWVGMVLTGSVALVCGVGCDKLKKKPGSAAAPTKDSEDPTVTKGPGGGVVVGGASAGGGGGGAVQAVRGAVKRAVTQNDLQQIRIYIENASLASGRMPSPQETYQALKREAPNIATLIDEQVITLHPARSREGVWAYETAALQNGGLVLTNSGVERMDAPTLRQRLGQR